MRPTVTIGVCARNAEKLLPSALESALAQDYPHEALEIVMVDDGSGDGTLNIMKAYAAKTDIEAHIFSGEWKGIGFARNVVLNNAHGKYIVWLDSDQTIEKSFVRKQVTLMEKYPKAGIALACLRIMPHEHAVLALDLIPDVVSYSRQDWVKPSKLPGTCGAMYRVAAARAVGGFDEEISGVGEDIDIARRIREAGWTIIQGNAVFYESHGSLTTWRSLWARYVHRGQCSRRLYSRRRIPISLYRMNPVSSFIVALTYIVAGYKLTKRKIVFLIPFHYPMKMLAWFYGFSIARTI